jgi:hypothetical protein
MLPAKEPHMSNPSALPSDLPSDDGLATFIGQIVILDTQGPLIYIGTLERVTAAAILLTSADVHDSNDSRASKDLYLVETRDLGVRVNRASVLVMRHQVASISLLQDVVD